MRCTRYPLRAARLLVLSTLLCASAPGLADPPATPTAPTRWVTDRASLLAPATRDGLDARLQDFERRSGHQVLVYVDRTTAGEPLELWTARAFGAWRVGRRGLDDGLALFVFTEDRRLRIEVGYGLEATVTDVEASRILREVATPLLQRGDNDGAVSATAGSLLALLDAQPASGKAASTPDAPAAPPLPVLVLGLLVFLVFLVFLVRHPALGWALLSRGFRGGRGGGGSGGGFSGGGGRSGGGGASGSW